MRAAYFVRTKCTRFTFLRKVTFPGECLAGIGIYIARAMRLLRRLRSDQGLGVFSGCSALAYYKLRISLDKISPGGASRGIPLA